ncbi:uncharacterized protein LOC144546766 [Carex rostrata]
MSSSGSHAMSTSDSITSTNLYRPLNSMDPGWKYGRLTEKSDPNLVKCLLCDFSCTGGITRFKWHLAGIKGNIRKCPKANAEVQKEIIGYLEILKKKAEDRKKKAEELVADVNINSDDSEPEELETERDKKRLRLKKPVNLVKEKGVWKQQVIKDTYAHWWSIHGSEAPYLRNIAIKILGLTCSASGCERNWSTFEWTHSKKRGKLEVQRLNDIVFVQFNARINDRKILRKSDPMCAREEEQDEYVRDWTGGSALDLPEEIGLASSSTSSSTPLAGNTNEVGIDDIGDDDITDDDDDDDNNDDDDDDDEELHLNVSLEEEG